MGRNEARNETVENRGISLEAMMMVLGYFSDRACRSIRLYAALKDGSWW